MLDEVKQRSVEARGISVALAACAEALINEPSETVLRDVRCVAQTLGSHGFDAVISNDELRQRYYDRFFVAKGSLSVPCWESCMRGSAVESGRRVYGSTTSSQGDHALRCYKAVGFDWHALQGFDLAVKTLHPDSLAVEVAFVAYLKLRESEAETEQQAERYAQFATQFVREHVGVWAPAAASALAEGDNDFYAAVAALIVRVLEELR